MTRFLYLLPLFAIAALSAAAQQYISFPASGTVWAENFLPRDDSAKRIVYRGLLQQDTLINGRTYHGVFESRDSGFATKTYLGALRDDPAARKVYYVPATGSTELLLYNFALRAGDSVRAGDHYYNIHQSMAVKTVDSIQIGGLYRRRIVFDYPFPTMWVEGIGNLVRGLLWFGDTFPNNGTWNELVCMRDNGGWFYHLDNSWMRGFQNAYPDCDQLWQLNQPAQSVGKPAPEAAVRVSPNPLTGEGKLQISPTGTFETLQIYTMSGALIATEDVRNKSVVPLRASTYAGGIYYYRLTGPHAVVLSGRFSVAD